MVSFFGYAPAFTLLFLLLAAPVVIIARRRALPKTAKRFIIGAVVCGVICGFLSASSRRLETQCEAEGNPSCFDAGATGMQFLIIASFAAASLGRTYLVVND